MPHLRFAIEKRKRASFFRTSRRTNHNSVNNVRLGKEALSGGAGSSGSGLGPWNIDYWSTISSIVRLWRRALIYYAFFLDSEGIALSWAPTSKAGILSFPTYCGVKLVVNPCNVYNISKKFSSWTPPKFHAIFMQFWHEIEVISLLGKEKLHIHFFGKRPISFLVSLSAPAQGGALALKGWR